MRKYQHPVSGPAPGAASRSGPDPARVFHAWRIPRIKAGVRLHTQVSADAGSARSGVVNMVVQ